MLAVPLATIITKIKEEKGASEEEINAKITAKMEELSGLVSKEGAAHIVANEYGVKVLEQTSGRLQIKNVLEGMRSVELVAKVLQVYDLVNFTRKKDGGQSQVQSLLVGDETGVTRLVAWGDQTKLYDKVKQGDVVKVNSATVRKNQGRQELHLSDKSALVLNPPGEEIKAVASQNEKAERKQIKDLKDNDQNIELLGTVVQAFDPRFFEVCSVCGKRTKGEDGVYTCEKDGKIEPDYSYVFNVILDDGTETMRIACFRNQAQHLLGKSHEDIKVYRENPEAFQQMKNDLLGNVFKIVGRVKNNEMFSRLEFTAQLVMKPNPDEEIAKLEKEAGSKAEPSAEEAEVQKEVEKVNLPDVDEI